MRGILMYVAAYALGRAAASARARTEALAEQTLRLERERRRDEERAAERERARIARDMHDILAHSITLMVVQAEAGPVVVEHSPGVRPTRSMPSRRPAVTPSPNSAGYLRS